jgi:hypothetical protein
MAKPRYLYPDASVSSPRALKAATLKAGIADAVITLDGTLACIATSTGTQTLADQAIALATDGTVFADGSQKIHDVRATTAALQAKGISWERPSDSVTFEGVPATFWDMDHYKAEYEELVGGYDVLPVPVTTLDGRVFTLDTLADAEGLYSALAARIAYTQGAVVNGDGSLGEAKMVVSIQSAMEADDRTALDALVDTRA